MYNLVQYGNMLTDRVRVTAYREAIEQTVSGKRVLEIGGGTGFFACLASSLGALHVTSIERNKSIALGPALAKANGLRNIEFVLGSSEHFQRDRDYDVVIHDLRGSTPFFQRNMATLRDASRLLKSGGQFLPRRDRIFAALVEDFEAYSDMEGVWGTDLAGLDLTALRANTHRRLGYKRGKKAKHWEPQLIADVVYSSPKADEAESHSGFVASFGGTTHGLVIWFETELTDSVGYTTNPWAPDEKRGVTYGVVFLPWARPVKIEEAREYQLKVGLDPTGRAWCELSQELAGSRMLLGSFVEKARSSRAVELPIHYRFSPHPLLSAYRAAFQGMEKGERVPRVVERIKESCDELESDAAAYRVLSKCVDLTQVRAKRGRERVTRLKFRDCRLRLVTNSNVVREQMLERLAPSWRVTRSKKGRAVEITLLEVYTADGQAYNLSVDGKSHPFHCLDKALHQLELLALQFGVLGGGSYVQVGVRYTVREGKAYLALDDSSDDDFCLLDHKQRLIPYATSGRNLEHAEVLEVVGVDGQGNPSPAVVVSLLIQRCRNLKVLPDPLVYFSKLVGV